MKTFAILLLVCCIGAASARELKQNSPPSYPTVAGALSAAANAPILSTLLAAVGAADLTIPANATWTIFAPTNKAFADPAIQEKTGLSAADLLLPANKAILVQVLSYHVVPAAAVASSDLTDGQEVDTALAGTSLTINLTGGNVIIKSGGDDATVVTPDIKAGRSIVHVIDKVLLPASLVKA